MDSTFSNPSDELDPPAATEGENPAPLLTENPFPVIRVRRDGLLVYTNLAAERLTRLWKWLPGEICPERTLQREIRAAYNSEEPREIEISIKSSTYIFNLVPVLGENLVDLFGHDISNRKRAEAVVEVEKARLAALFHILQFRALNIQAFLDYALDEVINLTQSKLGYIYFYDEQKKEFMLNSWSRKVMEACSITEPRSIYSLEKTGVWGEVVRQKQPIILNDFQAPHPLKKGYPEGHAQLKNFMSIPIYWKGVIAAVVGVANKETDYNETDLHQMEWLMEATWKIVDEKKVEEAREAEIMELQQKNEELFRLQAQTRRQIQLLNSLQTVDLSMVFSGGFNRKIALHIMLERAIQQLKIHAAAILNCDLNTQNFEYYLSNGFQNPPPLRVQYSLGDGCARQAILERSPVVISNLADEPAARSEWRRLSTESFVTYLCLPLVSRGIVHGLLELYHREAFEVDHETLDYLEKLANQAATAIDGSEAFEQLQRAKHDLTLAYDHTLEGWAQAVEVHAQEEAGSTLRMAKLTVQLASLLGVGKDELAHIYHGALLHDVGIINISDEIIRKSSPLTLEEWEIMRRHPQRSYEMLAPIPFLKPALDIPYCHHEKWDGSGYPRGLKGRSIPLAARIFAVINTWNALVSEHPQRKAFSHDKALAYILEQSEKQFDPEIVEAFQKLAANGLREEIPGPTQLFFL